jgi:large subunit ribosomal protein L7/L12
MKFTNKTTEKMATDPKLFAIADTLSKLTVLEAKELVRILEEDYGIKGVQAIAPVGIVPIEEVAEVKQTEFDVCLKEIGGQKLQMIKKAKELFGLTLIEAKNLIESAPCKMKGKVSIEVAENLKREFELFGGVIEIK